MKKVLSIVLAIAMIASMATVAFANSMVAEDAAATGSSSHDVFGSYVIDDDNRTDMYRVEVVWGAMTFNYTEAAEVWDTEEHIWAAGEEAGDGVWAPTATGANVVTLKNHSSEAVTVSLAFADNAEDADDLSGAWTWAEESEGALAAVVGEGAEAVIDETTATLAITGDFTDEDAEGVLIGTVTASIA